MANYDETLNRLNKVRYEFEDKENELNAAREDHIENLVGMSVEEILSILDEYNKLTARDLRLVLTDLVRKVSSV